MQSTGNGCLIVWVAGSLAAAIATGLGTQGSLLGNDGAPQSGQSGKPILVEEQVGMSEQPDGYRADAIVLDRSQDGHFYADTEINGQKIRMLVDTGATAIALARADARRAGIGVSIGMPQVVGQGASGDVHGEIVNLDRVSLGGASAVNVHAIVLDEGQISLLGQNFLSRFDSVEIKGDRMVLR